MKKLDYDTKQKLEYLNKTCKTYCALYNVTNNYIYWEAAEKTLTLAKELYSNAVKLWNMEDVTEVL